jgi:hypothetical protein
METPKAASESQQLPISTITARRHRELLIRAVANVISSPIAKQTYAQIVDGLPLSEVADDGFDGRSCIDHPLYAEHTQFCPGVVEEAETLCSRFDANALLMPSQVRNICRLSKPPCNLVTICLTSPQAPCRL